MPDDLHFMELALQEARAASDAGEVPIGAVLVHDDSVLASSGNRTVRDNDPTAHAEIVAIRAASRALGHFELTGCDIYTTCEPCPMCLGAIYWSRPARVFYANLVSDAAAIGFDDAQIYSEFKLPPPERRIPMIPLLREDALQAFREWEEKPDKTHY